MNHHPILDYAPYDVAQKDKNAPFMKHMKPAVSFHYKNCPEFKSICQSQGFSPNKTYTLEDIPYIPVAMFKKFLFSSVPKSAIVKTLFSSSTSGTPSKIPLDNETINNQRNALIKILSHFFNNQRLNFIIFDTEATVKSIANELSSRGTAIRGMLPVAKKFSFILDKNLQLDFQKLEMVIASTNSQEPVCYFGFTWLLYTVFQQNKDKRQFLDFFKKLKNQNNSVLHIGGWKKLTDIAVTKELFNTQIAQSFSLLQNRIIDVYGMTEQLGTIYPDCPYGYKHVPFYSDIIIRNTNTLEPVGNNTIGFIQLVSPLPHSYPGISILSDDLGKIMGTDSCPCGRKGKYFVFEKRSEAAELKGCGDTLNL